MLTSTFRLTAYAALAIMFIYSLLLAAEFDLLAVGAPTTNRHQKIEFEELLVLSGLFSILLSATAVLNSLLGTRERRHRARAERHANLDVLTGIPNRRLFFDRLEGALARTRDRAVCALILMDLDGFKPVNDVHGHGAGDAVLVEVASRLAKAVGSWGVVARLGGDEFAVLVEGKSAIEGQVAKLVEHLRTEISRPIAYNGAELSVGASIGVAFASSGMATPTALVEAADGEMYRAKRKNRDRIAA